MVVFAGAANAGKPRAAVAQRRRTAAREALNACRFMLVIGAAARPVRTVQRASTPKGYAVVPEMSAPAPPLRRAVPGPGQVLVTRRARTMSRFLDVCGGSQVVRVSAG